MDEVGPRRGLDPGLCADPEASVEAAIDAELRSHFEGTIDLLMSRGLSEEEARKEATRRFGDVAAHRRRLTQADRRRAARRGAIELMDGVRTGLIAATKGIRRSPAHALAVIVTLGLGIGANTTMFRVIDRLLLRAPAGIDRPGTLRRVYLQRRDEPGDPVVISPDLSWLDVADLDAAPAFTAAAAWYDHEITLGEAPDAERVRVTAVTASLFPMLGVAPAAGRYFREDEDRPGASPTAVLSHELWVRRFGADPDVLGRAVRIGSMSYQVVGVAPPDFTGAALYHTDVWVPLWPGGTAILGEDWHDNRGYWWLQAAVRLAPHVSDQVAAEQATAVHRVGHEAHQGYDPDARLLLTPLIEGRGPLASTEARVSMWLAGVALLVLLVACANVANLQLARVLVGHRDMAVRRALGSSRTRLMTHTMADSFVLSALGGALAVGLAAIATRVVFPALLPDVDPGRLGGSRLFAFTAGAALLATVLVGLVPAIRVGRSDPAPILREGGRTHSSAGSRLGRGLVAAQSGLSAILLVGAGLFLTSLREASRVDMGFDVDRVAFVQIERTDEEASPVAFLQPPADGPGRVSTPDLYRRMEEALPRLPGVESAARTVAVPFGISLSARIRVPGRDSLPRLASGAPLVSGAAPGYFTTMGQEVLRGREFTGADLGTAAEPVVIVNQVMADHVWPDGDPLASCVQVGAPQSPCARVVGVVENAAVHEVGEDPVMAVWIPILGDPVPGVSGVMVRTVGRPAERAQAIRAEVSALDPTVRFVSIRPLSDRVGERIRSWQLGASLFGAFGLLAVLVAGIGMYGMLAFEVARKRSELGIRRALGAPQTTLVGDVVLQAMRAVSTGAAAGLLIAALASPRIVPLLFETSPWDARVFLLSGLVLLVVTLAAAGLPAIRASRVDPEEVLR